MPPLSYRIDGNVATITIDNPPQNRYTQDVFDELAQALVVIGNSDARALLLHATGPDFSYGGDINPWPKMTTHEVRAMFEQRLATFNAFERLPIPTVAAVQGLCLGGGFELAVRADVLIAGESSRFGHPEQAIGLIALLGGIYRIAERAGRSRALEWAFTSEQVPVKVMEHHGIVNRVVADDALLAAAMALVQKLAAGATRAHAAHKALLRAWETGGVPGGDAVLYDIAMPLFETDDVKGALPAAVDAYVAGKPRSAYPFAGR